MAPRDRLLTRAAEAGIALDRDVADKALAYFEILGKWNKRLNLTGLDVDASNDVALDRLLVEPLVGATRVGTANNMVDVGSGGGSPGIPFALGLTPRPRLTMVESRARKSTFLKEALRHIGLEGLVATDRFEHFATQPVAAGAFDLVTVRAVRPDPGLWLAAVSVLRPGGLVCWFHGEEQEGPADTPGLVWGAPSLLVPSLRSYLTIGKKGEGDSRPKAQGPRPKAGSTNVSRETLVRPANRRSVERRVLREPCRP